MAQHRGVPESHRLEHAPRGAGAGCGSGPLTGRYFPPLGGFLYFLRPGTTKLPLFPGLPLFGASRRSWFDAALYAAALASMVRALVSPAPSAPQLFPVVALIAVLGVTDKTIFLAARAEHYWTTAVLFLLCSGPAAFVPGAKAVQAALWFWAGFSNLNHHFPHVVCVMMSNSPFTRFDWIRKRMYRCIFVESEPLRRSTLEYRIADAKSGLRERGTVQVRDLRSRHPLGRLTVRQQTRGDRLLPALPSGTCRPLPAYPPFAATEGRMVAAGGGTWWRRSH